MKKRTISIEYEDYFEMGSLKKTFKDVSDGADFDSHLLEIQKEIDYALPILLAKSLADILGIYLLKHFKSASEKGTSHVCTDHSSTHH